MSDSDIISEHVIIVSTTENSVESGTLNENIISAPEATVINDAIRTEYSNIGVYDSVIATLCVVDQPFATKDDEPTIDRTFASMVDHTFATTVDRTIATTLIGVDQISLNNILLKEKQNNGSTFFCCYGATICFNYVTTFFIYPCNAVTEYFCKCYVCNCTCCDCSQCCDCITNCCTCACCNDCNCDIEACLMCCCCCCCCQQ
jgi:hypothetical protein